MDASLGNWLSSFLNFSRFDFSLAGPMSIAPGMVAEGPMENIYGFFAEGSEMIFASSAGDINWSLAHGSDGCAQTKKRKTRETESNDTSMDFSLNMLLSKVK